MAGKTLTLRTIRANDTAQVPPRLGLRIVAVFVVLEALLLLMLSLLFPVAAGAAGVKAEVSTSTSAGYARFVFRFAEETEAEVRLNNGILVIGFKRPVEVSVDRIAIGAPSYVNAARRDPDGLAVRLALGLKVTVNTMSAGERLFVDLLPEGWVGLPPGLPQEVVEELAKRARDAEKSERQRRMVAVQRQPPPIRLRVGTQPTFTRYVFELPDLVPVITDRTRDKLSLTFQAPLRFDLADAQAALPPTVASIDTQTGEDNVSVRFDFADGPDIRTFREDSNFIVDVMAVEARKPPEGPALAMAPETSMPAPPASAPSPPANAARPGPAGAEKDLPLARPVVAAPSKRGSDANAGPVAGPNELPPGPPKVAGEGSTAPPPGAPKTTTAAEQPSEQPAVPAAGAIASNRSGESVVVEVRRVGEALRLEFPFATPTPAAVFHRADTVWMVFDSTVPIDVAKLVTQSIGSVRSATVTRSRGGQVVRIKVDRPKLTSVEADGALWTVTLGDILLDPTRPLGISRVISGPHRASAVIPFDAPQRLHRVSDPEVGDTLLVVTALGPARGFLRAQSFVEFQALPSTHGVAIHPIADDLNVEIAPDKILIARPPGLTLSNIGARVDPAREHTEAGPRPAASPFMFDSQSWGFDRQAEFVPRQADLIRVAADAPEAERGARRLDLSRFYFAREMYAEAKAVLDVLLSGNHSKADERSALVLRAAASVMIGRGAEALKDLSQPAVGDQFDAPLWRAMAFARQGKWIEARDGFGSLETAMTTMPIELQRVVYKDAMRVGLELRDFADAANNLNELETIGVRGDSEPAMQVFKGRIAEGLGRIADALAAYRAAADGPDRPAAAEGRLREILLRASIGQVNRAEAIDALELLTTIWRGDATEVQALQLLERLYTEENRYRDAFHVMRTALNAHPASETTRRIQNDAAAVFDALFLNGKVDAMPAIEALSLFYDYRELTPVGRRGDEMIRRMADRLVSVDLLDQAAALLQHQVDHRLQGAARAQIAIRLAVIYLMGRKPDRAIQTLRATRSSDLPNDVRNQRLLLEARALSDTGRYNLALELISNMEGREVERLRADMLWAAHRWREAAEQIEKLYGERWRDFAPLADVERTDILRAGVAFSLADDRLGIERFRQKFAPKMAASPDQRAFDVATTDSRVDSAEFVEIARKVAVFDTLDSFLRDLKARFPQTGAVPLEEPATPPQTVVPGAPRAS